MKSDPSLRTVATNLHPQTLSLIVVLIVGLWSAGPVSAKKLTTAQPESVGMSSTRLKRLSAVLNRYVEEEKLPGGVTLVARRGKILYREPFGQRDREAKSPMQEEGKLLITDSLGKYLPEFQHTSPACDGTG